MDKRHLSIPLVVTLSFLAGCDTLREEPGITYARSVQQLGINPVYPPREDLQVGDLYAVEDHTQAGRLKARDAYIDTVNLTRQIQEYLRTRYKFSDTNLDTKVVSPNTQVVPQKPQKDATGGLIPARSDLQTLPISGLPEIEVDSGITVGVQGQPQGLAALFGFEAAKTLKMSLRFGGVTSYSVPLIDAHDRLDAYCSDPQTAGNCSSASLASLINQRFNLADGEAGSVKAASIYLVDKVYLARQITYTFNDAILAAAAASALGSAGTAPAVSTTAIDKAVAKGDSSMINALADMQNSLNDAAAKNGAPGGAFSIAGVSVNGVSFNEVFERPVVVGYEAATRKVE